MAKGDYIPDAIIADILSKLPSRSVLRFKIACKTWYSLISDPVFINLHSKRAPQNPKILFSTSSSQLQLLDYERSSFEDSCLSRPINFPEKTHPHWKLILGSNRGLVCLNSYGKSYTILNPLTGEYSKIPKFSCEAYYHFHGFGFDSVANDFKLVLSADRITCYIFSLKANSWKTIECTHVALKCRFALSCSGTIATVLNGIFYWLVEERSLLPYISRHREIVAFDVSKTTFEKVQLLEHMTRKSCRAAGLLEHKGCFCVSFEASNNNEIWMLKEYGGWAHLLTIKNYVSNGFPLSVLCIFTRNEALFDAQSKFMRRRREENKLDEIIIREHGRQTALYVETLVSPNAEDWP